MATFIHRADSRGVTSTDWLDSKHSFSFGEYYDGNRVRFGALRVLNDDTVAPGKGFGTHPHRDMEIVTIPLSGALEHKDSTGATGVLRPGQVQVMTAGSGIFHSEYNHSRDEPVRFLQLWILPARTGLPPRYDEKDFTPNLPVNGVLTLVSSEESASTLRINQDARLSLARIQSGNDTEYGVHGTDRGLYAFVIEGAVRIEQEELHTRDAIGVTEPETVSIAADADSEILLIDVPMR